MSRYVFDNPDAMFDWIDCLAMKLQSIPRDKFGKIEVTISQTEHSVNYNRTISPKDKEAWRRKNEKK